MKHETVISNPKKCIRVLLMGAHVPYASGQMHFGLIEKSQLFFYALSTDGPTRIHNKSVPLIQEMLFPISVVIEQKVAQTFRKIKAD
jgi:hypothetical protein